MDAACHEANKEKAFIIFVSGFQRVSAAVGDWLRLGYVFILQHGLS